MMRTHVPRLKRCFGCMLGVASGDALGAPVEFLRLHEEDNQRTVQ